MPENIKPFPKKKTRIFLKKIAKVFFGLNKLPPSMEKMNDGDLTKEFNELYIKINTFFDLNKKRKGQGGGWLPATAARGPRFHQASAPAITISVQNMLTGAELLLLDNINPHELSVQGLYERAWVASGSDWHYDVQLIYRMPNGDNIYLDTWTPSRTIASYGLDEDGEEYVILLRLTPWVPRHAVHAPAPAPLAVNPIPVPPMGWAWLDVPFWDPRWEQWIGELSELQRMALLTMGGVGAGFAAIVGIGVARRGVVAGILMIGRHVAPNLNDVMDIVRNVVDQQAHGGHRKKSKRRRKTKRRKKRKKRRRVRRTRKA